MSELTGLNLAAYKSLLMQPFDLHIVADLQGTNISILIATVGLRQRFMFCLRTDENKRMALLLKYTGL